MLKPTRRQFLNNSAGLLTSSALTTSAAQKSPLRVEIVFEGLSLSLPNRMHAIQRDCLFNQPQELQKIGAVIAKTTTPI